MTEFTHNCPRLYLSMRLQAGETVLLPENQTHYLRNVLRKEAGDTVRIFNAADGEWGGRLTAPTKKSLAVTCEKNLRPSEDALLARHLLFSPIKKDRQDMLIEKAVELGVTHFHPILFQRTIVREIKPERIMAQMIEAAEQCERLDIPSLAPLMDLRKAIAGWADDTPIFAALERSNAENLKPCARGCAFLVGPEGGITSDEVEFLCCQNFVTPVSLGSRILRAETAVFYGLSVLSS